MSDNIYVGKANIHETQYGDIMKVNLVLSRIPKEYIRDFENNKGETLKAITLNVIELRNPDQRGNTHTVRVDTWKPEKKKEKIEDKLPF